MKRSNGGAVTKNEKILLWILGILSILALCYILIISPAQNKWKPIKNEIKEVDKKLEEVKNIDNEIDMLQRQYDKLMVEYEESTKELPKSDRYPQIFRDMEDKAIASGLDSVLANFYDPEVVKTVESKDQGESTDSTDSTNQTNDSNLEGMKIIQVDYQFKKQQESDPDTMTKVLKFVDELENYQKYTRVANIGEIKETSTEVAVKVYFYERGEEEDEVGLYEFN